MASKQLTLQPLSQTQIREVIRLKNAYMEDLDLLQKRREFSMMERDDAVHLLEEAAENVVRIRAHLEQSGAESSHKLRSLSGDASDYLWQLEKVPVEEDFVRGLVHSSLKLQTKYVCGLTEAKVDEWMQQINEFRNANQSEKLAVEGTVLEDDLLRTWNETDVLLKVTVAKDAEKFWNSSLVTDMQQLVKQVTGFKRRLELMQKKRDFNKRRRTNTGARKSQDGDERGDGESATPPATPKPSEEKPAEQKPIEKAPEKTSEKVPEKAPEKAPEKPQEQPKTPEKPVEQPQTGPSPGKAETLKKDTESIIKIKTVAQEVNDIDSKVKEIAKTTSEIRASKPMQSLELIENLKRRCSSYASALMTDLLKLDELAGLNEAKVLKKQQISHIQSLLDDVDKLKGNLSELEVQIKPLAEKQRQDQILEEASEEFFHGKSEGKKPEEKKPEEKKPEEKKPEEKKPEEKKPEEKKPEEKKPAEGDSGKRQAASAEKKSEEKPIGGEIQRKRIDVRAALEHLRFDPRTEVEEEQSHFIVYISVPGVKKDDISIEISPENRTIAVSGTRIPTEEEEANMRKLIKTRHAPKSDYEEDTLLLKYSVGRFGTFSRVYQIPSGVDFNEIQGNFKDGILILLIPKPKVQAQPRVIPISKARATPGAQPHPSAGYPFGGLGHVPFQGDNTVWW